MAWTIALSDADISTLTTAYTMAAGSEGRMSASFTNRNTSASATVQLWVVPSGETRGNEHLKEAGTTLGLAGTPQANLERFFVVPAGAVVFVQASTANVSCQVQGDVVAVGPTTSSVENLTASIVFDTGWSNRGNTALKLANGSVVSLVIEATSAAGISSTTCTLPTSCRPSKNITAAAIVFDASFTYNLPAYVFINTSGVVSFTFIASQSFKYF
jgi:hypothetical protein